MGRMISGETHIIGSIRSSVFDIGRLGFGVGLDVLFVGHVESTPSEQSSTVVWGRDAVCSRVLVVFLGCPIRSISQAEVGSVSVIPVERRTISGAYPARWQA
jgi:hypothetical protein